MSKISIICAMANNRVIGKNNQMPWHLSPDLQHFKKITLGKVIVMGRATYESIGRPLPGRTNVVLSRQKLQLPGVECYTSLEDVLAAYADRPEIMIIGGANLYAQTITMCNKMYLTYIDLQIAGDRFFPQFDADAWTIESDSGSLHDEDSNLDYKFVTLQR